MDEAREKARERYQRQNGLTNKEADALWPDLEPREDEPKAAKSKAARE